MLEDQLRYLDSRIQHIEQYLADSTSYLGGHKLNKVAPESQAPVVMKIKEVFRKPTSVGLGKLRPGSVVPYLDRRPITHVKDEVEEAVFNLLSALEEFDNEKRRYIHYKIMTAVAVVPDSEAEARMTQKDVERIEALNHTFEHLKKCKWTVVFNVRSLPDPDPEALYSVVEHLLGRTRGVSDWTKSETKKVIAAGIAASVGLESEDDIKNQILREQIPMEGIRNAIYAEVELLHSSSAGAK
jgi:hypothetical protein